MCHFQEVPNGKTAINRKHGDDVSRKSFWYIAFKIGNRLPPAGSNTRDLHGVEEK
jgi:hypothetical protein